MRMPRPGIIAMIAVCALTDFAAALKARDEFPPSWPFHCFIMALTFSQNALLWTWASIGRTRFIIRFGCAGIGILGLSEMFAWAIHSPHGEDWIFVLFCATTAVLMLASWAAARLRGWELIRKAESTPASQRTRMQFSLWNVMELAAVVALCAAAAKSALSPMSWNQMIAQELLIAILLPFPFTLLGIIMTWVLLRRRLSVPPLFFFVGTAWLMSVIARIILKDNGSGRPLEIVATFPALSIAPLIVCRLCAYRLVRFRGAADRCSAIGEPGRVQRR